MISFLAGLLPTAAFLLDATSYSAAAAISPLSNSYSTAGHPNANGLTITLRYPAGWERREGFRPHVIQTFYQRETAANCNLQARELGRKLSQSEIAQTLPAMADAMTEQGLIIINRRPTKLDGLPAYLIVSAGSVSNAGLDMKMTVLNISGVYKSTLITFTCGRPVRPADTKADLAAAITEFELIGSTIVVQDRWR